MADATLEVKIQALVDGLDQVKEFVSQIADATKGFKDFGDAGSGLKDVIDSIAAAASGDKDALDKLGNVGQFVQGVFEGMKAELSDYVQGLHDADDGHKKAGESASAFGEKIEHGGELVKEFGVKLLEISGIATLVGSVLSAISIEHFFEEGFKGATDLESAMARLAVASGKATDELKETGEAASKVGEGLGFDSGASVQALTQLTSGIGDVDGAMTALLPTLQLAKVANLDVATSATAVTTALNQYGLGADQAQTVTDTLVATSQSAAVSIQDLVTEFRLVGPYAANAGLSFQQTATILGGVAEKGLRGRQAFGALIEVFSQLGDASSEFRQRLVGIGVDTTNLGTVFQQLAQKGSAGQFAIAAFGDHTRAVLAQLTADGGASLDALGKKLDDTSGASAKAAAEIEKTFTESLGRLRVSFFNLAEALATPALQPLTDGFNRLGEKLKEFAASPAFASIIKAFTQLVENGIKFLSDALDSVPWDEAAKDTADFFDKFGKYVDDGVAAAKTVGVVVGVVADSISLVFNTLKTTVTTAVEVVVGAMILLTRAGQAAANASGDFLGAKALGAQAEQLEQTLKDLDAQAETSALKVGANLSSIGERLNKLGESGTNASKGLKNVGVGADSLKGSADGIDTALRKIGEGFNAVTGETTETVLALSLGGDELDNLAASAAEAQTPLEGVGTAFSKTTQLTAGLQSQIEGVQVKMEALAQAGQGNTQAFKDLNTEYNRLTTAFADAKGWSNLSEQSRQLQSDIDADTDKLAKLTAAGQGFGDEAARLATHIHDLQVQFDALQGPIEGFPKISDDAAKALKNLGVGAEDAIVQANAAGTEFKTVFAEVGTGTEQNLKISQAAFTAWAQKSIASFDFVDEATKNNVIAMLRQAAQAVGLGKELDALLAKNDALGQSASKVAPLIAGEGNSFAQAQQQANADVNAYQNSTKAIGDATKQVQGLVKNLDGTVTDSSSNMVFANQQVADSFLQEKKDAADFANNVSGVLGPALEVEANNLTNFASHSQGAVDLFTTAMKQFFDGAGKFSAEAAADGTRIIQFGDAVNQASALVTEKIKEQQLGVAALSEQYDDLSDAAVQAMVKAHGSADELAASLRGDAAAAREGQSAFNLLGATDLGQLSSSLEQVAARIEQVKEAAKQAADSLKSLLSSTQDQIDQILGNQEAIEDRRHQEALAQIDALKAQGADQETINKAIKAENELHGLKLKDIQEQKQADAQRQQQQAQQEKQDAAQQQQQQQQANAAQQQDLNTQLDTQKKINQQIVLATQQQRRGFGTTAPGAGFGGAVAGIVGGAGATTGGPTPFAPTINVENALGTPEDFVKKVAPLMFKEFQKFQTLSR